MRKNIFFSIQLYKYKCKEKNNQRNQQKEGKMNSYITENETRTVSSILKRDMYNELMRHLDKLNEERPPKTKKITMANVIRIKLNEFIEECKEQTGK